MLARATAWPEKRNSTAAWCSIGVMTRSKKTAVAVTAALLALPAAGYAAISEIGDAGGDVKPACPGSPCRAIPRTTGFQVKVGDERAVNEIKQDGRIVAWTLTLGKPGPKQTAFFNENLGGESQAQLTIIRPGKHLYFRVMAQGEPIKLQPYFGQKVQIPLEKSIPVKKGWIVAVTVPTWAPALALDQPGTTSWRASRSKGKCDDFNSQSAQTQTNNVVRFYCLYRTARLAYSATIVSDPKPTAKTTG
jgi:hypothetical protein